jgi:hypothetical protein
MPLICLIDNLDVQINPSVGIISYLLLSEVCSSID